MQKELVMDRGFSAYLHYGVWVAPKATIINIPGYQSDVNGFNNKYVKLADHLVNRHLLQVVRMPNVTRPEGGLYAEGLLADVGEVYEWVRKNCGGPIYLMGFSAGGFAAAVVAAENPDVEKILLMEPSASGRLLGEFPREKLSQYRGEVYIVIGDTGVGYQVAELYQKAFSKAARVELHVIQNCDHQFKGEKNGKILSKAPLWAFAGDPTFPSPDGGIELY